MIKIHKVCDRCGTLQNTNTLETTPTILSIEFVEDFKKQRIDICGACFISMFKVYSQIVNNNHTPKSKGKFEGIKLTRKR